MRMLFLPIRSLDTSIHIDRQVSVSLHLTAEPTFIASSPGVGPFLVNAREQSFPNKFCLLAVPNRCILFLLGRSRIFPVRPSNYGTACLPRSKYGWFTTHAFLNLPIRKFPYLIRELVTFDLLLWTPGQSTYSGIIGQV
jgi:hypothetical protein